MEKFLIRVMTAVITSAEVKQMLEGLMKTAVREGTEEVRKIVREIPGQIDELQQQAVDRVDAMDGKMGNLQEQLTDIPGQIVGGVIDQLRKFNPLGGLFGQQ